MASKAQEAYRFEQDDKTISLILPDNWQFDRAGLLAGERLIIQLQRLEKEFLEQNERRNEITQSFSLALLNPSALTLLKENAECEFIIPEVMFDLIYPGQYKRVIKSVRLTMPCVTGPYTNIAAKLTLKSSKIRYEPEIGDEEEILKTSQSALTSSISTSSAQNDTGIFEFSSIDERYLPFEGAGAVESNWRLELPFGFRSFDYNTISDVILHISYTSKEDEKLRKDVEAEILEKLNHISKLGLLRMLSLKHNFPSAFNKLLNPSQGGKQETEFVIEKNYFPHFLSKMKLVITSTTIYLRPKGDKPVDVTSLKNLEINKTTVDSWEPDTEIKYFMKSSVSLSGEPNRTWSINAAKDGFSKEDLDDIIILINYRAKEST